MIVNQDYWDDGYSKYQYRRLPKNDPTRKIIEKYTPIAKK